MPMYVYACHKCGRQFEVRQRFQDDALTQCEVCEGQLRRVLQPVGIVFKGSGFYSTDYKSGSLAMPGATNGASVGSNGSSSPSDDAAKPAATPPPAKEAAPASSSGTSSSGG